MMMGPLRMHPSKGEGVWVSRMEFPMKNPSRPFATHWEVHRPPVSQAHALWHTLVRRIQEEIDDYESFAREHIDSARMQEAQRLRQWMQGKGARIQAELERQIVNADVQAAEEMRVSLEAALELIELDRTRDLTVPENRDYLLQTCQDTLFALRRAFRDIVTGESWPESPPLSVPGREHILKWAPTEPTGIKTGKPLSLIDLGAAAA